MSDLVNASGQYLDGRPPAVLEHSVRRPAGYVETTYPDSPTVRGETLMCVHCQKHWVVRPGSGITRGFCFNCMGPTCGKEVCEPCVPFEQAIENMERVDQNLRVLRGM